MNKNLFFRQTYGTVPVSSLSSLPSSNLPLSTMLQGEDGNMISLLSGLLKVIKLSHTQVLEKSFRSIFFKETVSSFHRESNFFFFFIFISCVRSSYSDDGLLYIYPSRPLFQILSIQTFL